ncbi:uncharacterized protein A4U43_C02F8950 [Asparagus officinalis]|uniref:Peptidase C1A papain C-terminal domain-containing protein n=1 Tax=Asparagus officinalis TaxID=4686 RepID=A0A5P1FIW3_ASPOF|nr:uncharacterized protein A4U43_C02F8950 [Asparagus officinalis]
MKMCPYRRRQGPLVFSDLTPKEFKEKFLGLRRGRRKIDVKGAHEAPILPTNDLPEDFDWRDRGAVTPVKNQGSCGSCWSFSTSGAMEGANFLATGKLVSLSEQQLVDCDHEAEVRQGTENISRTREADLEGGRRISAAVGFPAGGGGFSSWRRWVLELEAGFRARRQWVFELEAVGFRDGGGFSSWRRVFELGGVGINAVFMQTYIGGVSCPYICGKHLDHGVLLVGYGSGGYAPIRLKEKPYWIIKNSWGETWGEKGYYKICRGRNVCGVDSMVSTVSAIHTTPQKI